MLLWLNRPLLLWSSDTNSLKEHIRFSAFIKMQWSLRLIYSSLKILEPRDNLVINIWLVKQVCDQFSLLISTMSSRTHFVKRSDLILFMLDPSFLPNFKCIPQVSTKCKTCWATGILNHEIYFFVRHSEPLYQFSHKFKKKPLDCFTCKRCVPI